MRLDLGGANVSLDAETRERLSAALARPRHTAPQEADDLAAQGPLAAALSALLRDATALASDVVTAGRRGRGAPTLPRTEAGRPPHPRTGGTPAKNGADLRTAERATPEPQPQPLEGTLRVSVDTMPYLLDHCFFRQPAQADPADRWPVVPGTTVIAHLMEFAERAAPGPARGGRPRRTAAPWITATPAVGAFPVRIVPEGPDRVTASLGPYACATVELAQDRPRFTPPEPWTFPAEREEKPELTAGSCTRAAGCSTARASRAWPN